MKEWLVTWDTYTMSPKRHTYRRHGHRITINAETIKDALDIYYHTHDVPPSTIWDIIPTS